MWPRSPLVHQEGTIVRQILQRRTAQYLGHCWRNVPGSILQWNFSATIAYLLHDWYHDFYPSGEFFCECKKQNWSLFSRENQRWHLREYYKLLKQRKVIPYGQGGETARNTYGLARAFMITSRDLEYIQLRLACNMLAIRPRFYFYMVFDRTIYCAFDSFYGAIEIDPCLWCECRNKHHSFCGS